MRRFSFGPTLATKGRKFKGLRGFAGKPFHPPLTDVPVVAYLFGAVFDVPSLPLHNGHPQLGTGVENPLAPALRHSSSAGARMRTARWRGQPRSNKSISAWMSHRRSSAIWLATAGSTPALTRYRRRHVTSARRSTFRLP